jgi:hypothetical protein
MDGDELSCIVFVEANKMRGEGEKLERMGTKEPYPSPYM